MKIKCGLIGLLTETLNEAEYGKLDTPETIYKATDVSDTYWTYGQASDLEQMANSRLLDDEMYCQELNAIPLSYFLDGSKIAISAFTFTVKASSLSRTHIPLNHAWSITVHKSQGMSVDASRVVMDKIFAAGQSYVALSKVGAFYNSMRRLGMPDGTSWNRKADQAVAGFGLPSERNEAPQMTPVNFGRNEAPTITLATVAPPLTKESSDAQYGLDDDDDGLWASASQMVDESSQPSKLGT
ncbi:hypothetical protein SmJEL517_g01437 [Synchytrium microbalum]|uniref:ATP-dependent DNA helicase n=1 Tax=Synchytrium microbalum TaxID=1806994 RepID=A0A507C9A1_9FUNG|nr:uncharacterized protein SmJEL517_g01437 [Synchytrium microbalum]TPX36172.1 hypothetical protein SmJEL517_g01437 [Synchytrium microbalum]